MGAKRRTSASRGVVKKRTPERAPLTQAEKDVQQERRRIAREEKKALEERVGKMDCLEYSNFIAEQEQTAADEKDRKRQAACARRAEQKLREAQELDEACTKGQRELALKYDGTAGIKCVLCTRFCARAVEHMPNHKTGRLVECQHCDLCKEEIESEDPTLHSTSRDVLWTQSGSTRARRLPPGRSAITSNSRKKSSNGSRRRERGCTKPRTRRSSTSGCVWSRGPRSKRR